MPLQLSYYISILILLFLKSIKTLILSQFSKTLTSAGFTIAHHQLKANPVTNSTIGRTDQQTSYFCRPCKCDFHSHQQLQADNFSCHNYHTVARTLVDTSVCQACAKDFHTRTKVIKHLRNHGKGDLRNQCSSHCASHVSR